MKKDDIKVTAACIMLLVGVVLIFSGFWVDPTGSIHNSVLIAFGEIISFAAAIFGIHSIYDSKFQELK